jgi:hypothetical protein
VALDDLGGEPRAQRWNMIEGKDMSMAPAEADGLTYPSAKRRRTNLKHWKAYKPTFVPEDRSELQEVSRAVFFGAFLFLSPALVLCFLFLCLQFLFSFLLLLRMITSHYHSIFLFFFLLLFSYFFLFLSLHIPSAFLLSNSLCIYLFIQFLYFFV